MLTKIIDLYEWWIRGLSLLCPAFLRHLMQPKKNQIVICINDKEISVGHYNNDSNEPTYKKSFHIDNEIEKATTIKLISSEKKKNAEVILCLPENILLKKNLLLPAAVKSDLRQALGFEINRKTPFSEDEVYFDYLVNDENDGKLNINLYIAPAERVNAIIETSQLLGINFDFISLKEGEKIIDNINLSNNNTETNIQGNINKLTFLLSATTAILFLALLYFPLYLQDQNLEALASEVKKKRKDAIELQNLEKEKNIIFEQSHFLADKRAEQISGIELINEITQIVPDDTWLNRLVIKSGEVQLQGESSNASSLLQVIESSELFSNAQFRSPITKNNLTKKDRFNLSATIMEAPST
jgi:general secretion pathway protein L